MSALELKIGIVLNYKKAEMKKDELYCVKEHPWLKIANEKSYNSLTITKKNKRCVPADVAIGVFLENLPKNEEIKITVDYITPDEISLERFRKNDIVFVIIYDLLECFHLSKGKQFETYKHALKNADNVYPPYVYQKFINNKCAYYKYLAEKKIPVAPTHCISKKKWLKRDSDAYVDKLINKIKSNKWTAVIAKPVYGQESKDFAKFVTKPKEECEDNCDSGGCGDAIDCQKGRIKKYLSKNIPKYKSIVIQEYIPGFDKSNPEFRTYFIDGIYAYTVVTTDRIVDTPVQEGGNFKVPSDQWNYIMRFSKKVMETLPKFNLPGNLKSPILTRIDIGSGLEGVPYTFFVNEVEFVPSLYIEDQDFPVVEEIAKSLLHVAMEYRFAKSLPIKVKF
uniref:ATP-grasp domain-containing protein n=1 Tax=viral metagenome TaxID=1070528 RepID=A0A6C0AY71_9ZZZZ